MRLISLIVGIIIGFGAGYYMYNTAPQGLSDLMMMEDEMETDDSMDTMEHSHAMLEVDDSQPIPSVSLEALKDAEDGYNVRISVENFKLIPENVNGNPTPGEGHAHIFVNGTKIARLYGEWFHIGADKLESGSNTIEVTLNANDHSEWVHDEEHIADTVTVTK